MCVSMHIFVFVIFMESGEEDPVSVVCFRWH